MRLLWERHRGDIVGGVTVAFVALPLALAFGIASGAGPTAGMYSAIFAGLITSLFGGSPIQISGPTGAMTVVLVTIVAQHGIEMMLLAGLLAGIIQILLGLVRAGGFVKFLPHPVIAGFTNGIAVVIFLGQLDSASTAPWIAGITIIASLFAMKYAKSIPASLFGLLAAIAANELFFKTPHLVSGVPTTLPTLTVPIWSWEALSVAIGPAITICLLGSIEALLSATVGDTMTGQRSDGNRELIGQGLGNIVAAFVGGVPVTGAIARTAVNAKSGARTRLSGVIHAIVLLLFVLVLGDWAARIPLAALAAILMITSVRMVDWNSFALVPRASWSYALTLGATLVLTVATDLTIAVAVGFGLSTLLFLLDIANPKRVVEKYSGQPEEELFVPEHPDVLVYKLNGPLFFGVAEQLLERFEETPEARVLVLDMSQVPMVDVSGGLMLEKLATSLRERYRQLYVVGLSREPLRTLTRLGIVQRLGRRYVCGNLRQAMRRAKEELGAAFNPNRLGVA